MKTFFCSAFFFVCAFSSFRDSYAGKAWEFRNKLVSIKKYVNETTSSCFGIRNSAKKIHKKLSKIRKKDVGSYSALNRVKRLRLEFYKIKEYISSTCYSLKNNSSRVRFYIPNMLSSCLYCLGAGKCGSRRYAYKKYKRCSRYLKYTQDNLNSFNRYMPKFRRYAKKYFRALKKLKSLFG